VTEVPVESMTVAVTDKLLTAAVGVPLMVPVEGSRFKPAGKELTENVYGGMPPVTAGL
jgi:hypothetical protein